MWTIVDKTGDVVTEAADVPLGVVVRTLTMSNPPMPGGMVFIPGMHVKDLNNREANPTMARPRAVEEPPLQP